MSKNSSEQAMHIYRMDFDGIGCMGTMFFKIERRGFLWGWNKVAGSLTIEDAEKVVETLNREWMIEKGNQC